MTDNKKLNLSLNSLINCIIIKRKYVVWKLASGYCLCYCKTFFLLVLNPTESAKKFSPKSAAHYSYYLNSNNIIGERETTNREKQVYS